MGLAIFWIICAVITSSIAQGKGRDGMAWFFIGLFTGLIGVFLSVCVGSVGSAKK